MKRLGISLLRLLIGIGFTFSLTLGVTLTLLTLCDGSGENLALSRTGTHWEWSIVAVLSGLAALSCWLFWRRLPIAKPTRLFPMLESGLASSIITVTVALICPLALAGAVCHQILHRQAHDWFAIFLYSVGTIASWSQATQVWKQRHRPQK